MRNSPEATPLASAPVDVTATMEPATAGFGTRTGVVTVGGVVSFAEVTVRTVEPVTSPNVALMLLVPAATARARPVALMVATEVVAEAQVTELVMTAVVGVAVRAGGDELLSSFRPRSTGWPA